MISIPIGSYSKKSFKCSFPVFSPTGGSIKENTSSSTIDDLPSKRGGSMDLPLYPAHFEVPSDLTAPPSHFDRLRRKALPRAEIPLLQRRWCEIQLLLHWRILQHNSRTQWDAHCSRETILQNNWRILTSFRDQTLRTTRRTQFGIRGSSRVSSITCSKRSPLSRSQVSHVFGEAAQRLQIEPSFFLLGRQGVNPITAECRGLSQYQGQMVSGSNGCPMKIDEAQIPRSARRTLPWARMHSNDARNYTGIFSWVSGCRVENLFAIWFCCLAIANLQ